MVEETSLRKENTDTGKESDELEEKFFQSGHRIGKIIDKLRLVTKERYAGDFESKTQKWTHLINAVNLVAKLDEYTFSEHDKERIFGILEKVIELQTAFNHYAYLAKEKRRERSDVWWGTESGFESTYEQFVEEIVGMLEQLPKDLSSKIELESGHKCLEKFKDAIESRDIKSAIEAVAQIDWVLADNYSEFPNTLPNRASIRIIVEGVIRDGETRWIKLSWNGLNEKDEMVQPRMSIYKELIGVNPKKFGRAIIQFVNLTPEQKQIAKFL